MIDQNQDTKDSLSLSQKKIIFPYNSDNRNYKWSVFKKPYFLGVTISLESLDNSFQRRKKLAYTAKQNIFIIDKREKQTKRK